MSYWWVNQGRAPKQQREGGYLWAPKREKDGRIFQHHVNVSRLNIGDTVYCYSDGAVRGWCEVVSQPEESNRIPDLPEGVWTEDGFTAKVAYSEFSHPLLLDEIPLAFRVKDHGPFDRNGSVTQTYLTPITEGLASFIMRDFGGSATWIPEAFSLLDQLHLNPTKDFYSSHAEEFKQRLEKPFQQLLRSVGQRLRPEITELMETEQRLFSRILKNDYGRGGAWDFYWGAFYPKGGKRLEAAQLFLGMRKDYLEFGFYIGDHGKEQRGRFVKNCSRHLEMLEDILRKPLSRDHLKFGETSLTGDYVPKRVPGPKWNDWLNQVEQARIRASVTLSRNEVLVMSDDTLAEKIADVFHDLFPLVLLATKDDPLTDIRRYVEEIPLVDEVLNPEYSLEQCAAETHLDLAVLQRWVRAVERKKQAIFYGPPGTGKTFVAEKLALHMIGEGDGFTEIVQFHPSYAYEDFMQGLRPRALSGGGLEYVMTPGRFKDFCDRAREYRGRCVLIIDEINRANLSRVLGELMFLLEYRDQDIPLSGGGRFKIPQNVRIIGTMNTADRSIALVDHALRRRFAFLELYPDFEILRRFHSDTGFDPEGLINILERLNAAINDRHYSVGITFFLSPNIEEDIADIWQMELEPYIEELFFDQPDKAAGFEWDKVKAEIMR